MKTNVISFMLAIGMLIFVGVHYAEAQKPSNTKATENHNVIEEMNQEGQETEALSSENIVEPHTASQSMIENVPLIQQLPELPRGCEVTSLAMLLQFAGVTVDKMTLAEEINTIPFWDENGFNGNPNVGFVGDMYSFDHPGLGVYHTPIANLAESYLPGRIIDLTGEEIESIYSMINNGSPVWVITNSRFATLPESEFKTWNTASGEIQITYREHSVLVVGYDEENVYLNDPLAEQPYKSVPRASFEESWIQMGKQAVSYQ
ncbi:C39 family peptidase [Neobacillus sp. K501]